MRKLIINEKTDEIRCAIIEDNDLKEIQQTHAAHEDIVGNIYLGRVSKVLPGMQAAFVDIGLEQNGYLHRNEVITFQQQRNNPSAKSTISSYVREGEQILVQVVKEGNEVKGPKLTTNIEFGGQLLVYMPYGDYVAVSKKITDEKERQRLLNHAHELRVDNEGLLFRTSSIHRTMEDLRDEYHMLKNQYIEMKKITSKKPICVFKSSSFIQRILNEINLTSQDIVVCDNFKRFQSLKDNYPQVNNIYHDSKEGIFTAYKIDQEIDKLFKPIVWLKNGSYIVIEQTEAMVIIDVNTGKFSGKLSMRDTVLKTNILAAKEIAKQVRLRNLSGIILIDFIDMKHKEDQNEIIQTVVDEMKQDRVQHKVIGFTELNILQLTRKKVREPITKYLTNDCPICNGQGRIISAEAVVYKLERELWEHQFMDEEAIWIEATSDVISLINGEKGQHLNQLEHALNYKVIMSSFDNPIPQYHIKYIGNLKSINERIKAE